MFIEDFLFGHHKKKRAYSRRVDLADQLHLF